MKADPVSISNLLENRNRYCVPIYQRRYVWTKNKQWQPFWHDIRTKVIEKLANREQRFSHFMGAVVLESRAKPSVEHVPSFQVVDGQQRLTTFQLFLTAARHYAQKIGHDSASQNITRYILNSDPHLMNKPEVEIYKIWPTQSNREMFIDIIASEDRETIRKKYSQYWYKDQKRDQVHEYSTVPNLLGAYGYFYDRIRQAVETDDLSSDLDEIQEVDLTDFDNIDEIDTDQGIPIKTKLDVIWKALLEEFKVVQIVLDEGDDAQVIFETLNDRGEPLLASELVKNNLFQRADARGENAEYLFEEYWKPFEDYFWDQLEKQGRYKKKRVEFFLANFVAAKTAHDVTISKLFSEYKAFLKPQKGNQPLRYSSVENEIADLNKYGAIYREFIERNSNSELADFSKRLKLWDVTTANPLILRVWEAEALSGEEKASAFQLLLSLIVRRAVCDLGTKNYNNLFLSAIAKLDASEWSLQNLKKFFLDQTAESGKLPRDTEFIDALVNKPLYSNLKSAKTRAILVEIEDALNTKYQESQGLKDSLAVEHILPHSWQKHWPMMDGKFANEEPYSSVFWYFWYYGEDETPEGKINKRTRLLHSLGNLTLITPSFNSSVSNKGFEEKKAEFVDQSLLMLTKSVIAKNHWNEDTILERSKILAKKAVEIWPIPAQMTN